MNGHYGAQNINEYFTASLVRQWYEKRVLIHALGYPNCHCVFFGGGGLPVIVFVMMKSPKKEETKRDKEKERKGK